MLKGKICKIKQESELYDDYKADLLLVLDESIKNVVVTSIQDVKTDTLITYVRPGMKKERYISLNEESLLEIDSNDIAELSLCEVKNFDSIFLKYNLNINKNPEQRNEEVEEKPKVQKESKSTINLRSINEGSEKIRIAFSISLDPDSNIEAKLFENGLVIQKDKINDTVYKLELEKREASRKLQLVIDCNGSLFYTRSITVSKLVEEIETIHKTEDIEKEINKEVTIELNNLVLDEELNALALKIMLGENYEF